MRIAQIIKMCFILSNLFIFTSQAVMRKRTKYSRLSRAARIKLKQRQNPWERSGQYEGDIILKQYQRNAMSDPQYYWPRKEVPYQISSKFSIKEQNIIERAIATITKKTCVKIIPWNRRSRSENDGSIYISSLPGHGCSATVGFRNTSQTLYLNPKKRCVKKGVVLHEFLHVLGLWHQHAAHDRDKALTIIWKNIKPGDEPNFNKVPYNTTSFGYKYDYGSIMHYSSYAFSANGRKTIVPKSGDVPIGQRKKLSAIDIKKINKMYNCTDTQRGKKIKRHFRKARQVKFKKT